jgi:hypothetical protein
MADLIHIGNLLDFLPDDIRAPSPEPTSPEPLSPEQPTLEPPPRKPRRRHSPKGKATGWIEERLGNTKCQHPSTSYYYCWQEDDRRSKQYVPVRKMAMIKEMIDQRCSVGDILTALNQGPSTPKL